MVQVSVIASSFKAERFLKDFLQSMIEQSYQDFELVLHSNEPSLKELEVLEQFSHSINLTKLIENPVIPLYSAWNKCLLASKGEYIAIGNVDDLRTKNSLELMVKAFNDNPKVDFVYGNFTSVNSFPSNRGHLIDIVGQQEIIKTGMILGPFFMFKKSLLKKTGFFDEQFKSGGDYDFAMRLARIGQGKCLSQNLGYYLDEGKGLSTGSLLQPLERTVIEMRYGLRVLEKKYITKALSYDLEHMTWDHKKHNIKDFFKENSLQSIDYKEQEQRLKKESSLFGSLQAQVKKLLNCNQT